VAHPQLFRVNVEKQTRVILPVDVAHPPKKAVQEMVDKGLTKSTVQRLVFQYGRAIAEGGSKRLANTQLMPRYQLMMKIIELWPK
jgi:hypothetical protein